MRKGEREERKKRTMQFLLQKNLNFPDNCFYVHSISHKDMTIWEKEKAFINIA